MRASLTVRDRKWAKFRETNARKPCDECGKPRKGMWLHCSPCHHRRRRLGHPGQSRLTLIELDPYLREARRFLRENPKHSGITTALEVLDRWLRLSQQPHLKRAYLSGLTGKVLLPRFLALAFYQEAHPKFFKSHDAYLFALARPVLCSRLLKKPTAIDKTPTTKVLRATGLTITKLVGPLLLNASRTWLANRPPDPIPNPNPQSPKPRTITRTSFSGSILTTY